MRSKISGFVEAVVRGCAVPLAAVALGTVVPTPAGGQSLPGSPDVASDSVMELAVASFDEAWRIIRDTYFDPGFGGVDWEAVREELRPRVLSVGRPAEVRSVIREMLGRLGHSHLGLLPGSPSAAPTGDRPTGDVDPRGGTGRDLADPGLDVLVLEGRAIIRSVEEGSPAATAGVRPGWIVEEIDERTVPSPELEAGQARLNMLTRLRGPAQQPVRLVLRDGRDERHRLELDRREPPAGAVVNFGNLGEIRAEPRSGRLPLAGGRIAGYLRFEAWIPTLMGELNETLEAMRDVDGLVLDLRRNGGGAAAMVMGLAGHFVTAPVSLGTYRTPRAELRFAVSPRRLSSAGEPLRPFDGPVAVLVDELSGSASEVFAAGLQELGRARVFGRPSAGIVLPAVLDRLPSGDVLMHPVADFTTPRGVGLEGRGVVPDEMIVPTRKALLEGRDPVLEAALRWIENSASNH